MQTEKYIQQQENLPKEGKHIIANYDDKIITVYQAFNNAIAEYAIKNQKFGGNAYSFERMTWIKPNFMWMMYRSGWATKENQNRILSIKMNKAEFLNLLKEGVLSSYNSDYHSNEIQWKSDLQNSEIRLQWDPDHNPIGLKLERKAIQIGLKGEKLREFNEKWITQIDDITDFVISQRSNAISPYNELIVPVERVLPMEE